MFKGFLFLITEIFMDFKVFWFWLDIIAFQDEEEEIKLEINVLKKVSIYIDLLIVMTVVNMITVCHTYLRWQIFYI